MSLEVTTSVRQQISFFNHSLISPPLVFFCFECFRKQGHKRIYFLSPSNCQTSLHCITVQRRNLRYWDPGAGVAPIHTHKHSHTYAYPNSYSFPMRAMNNFVPRGLLHALLHFPTYIQGGNAFSLTSNNAHALAIALQGEQSNYLNAPPHSHTPAVPATEEMREIVTSAEYWAATQPLPTTTSRLTPHGAVDCFAPF